jgi:hypothetical protein
MRGGVEAARGREVAMSRLSRREFVRLGAVGAAAAPFMLDCVPRKTPRKPRTGSSIASDSNKSLLPEVPVQLINSREPFWAPN